MNSSALGALVDEGAAALRPTDACGLYVSAEGGGGVVCPISADRHAQSWSACSADGGLEVAATARRVPERCAAVLGHSIRNRSTSARIITGLTLRLEFERGSELWSVLTCGGGTPNAGYPPQNFELREQAFIGPGVLSLGTDLDGRSSNRYLPMLIASRAVSGQPGLWCGLEWSGEWSASLSRLPEGDRFRIDLTINVRRMRLEVGEVMNFPALHMGLFTGGLAGGTNALRRYIYQSLQPDYLGQRPLGRVTYDHWFGLANEIDAATLRRQVDRAAEMGIEVFCIDAGYFGDFPRDVGNWNDVDRRKFPDGLEPVAQYVRSKGMDVGLWFEFERAVRGSWAVREYPELFWPDPAGRGEFHLNLARRDAQDWAIEWMSGWIRRLGLRWTRLDHNAASGIYFNSQDWSRKVQFAYVAGLYRVYDQLRQRFPELMFENCASGGRRIDFGTLARSHTNWISDHSHDPHTCRWMQLRSQRFLPGNQPNTSMGIGKASGDPPSVDLEILSRATGKLSMDGDVASLSAAALARCRHWIELHKRHRHLLVQDFYQLSSVPRTLEDWDVAQWSAYDGSEGLLAAYRMAEGDSWRGAIAGIDTSAHYKLTDLDAGQEQRVSGEQLGALDLAVHPDSARLWHWRKLT